MFHVTLSFASTPVTFPTPVQVDVVPSFWEPVAAFGSIAAAFFTLFLAVITWRLVQKTANLAAQTALMASETKDLAQATGKSITLTSQIIVDEERHHRQTLQPRLVFRSIKRKASSGDDSFHGYDVQLENIGPGFAWNIYVDDAKIVDATPRDKSAVTMSLDTKPTRKLEPGERPPDRTRMHSTRADGLGPGKSFHVATIINNSDGIRGLRATYLDAFDQHFESSVDGVYKPGENYITEFKGPLN